MPGQRTIAATADLLVAGALAACAWALHATALGHWFSYDDFWHLRHVLTRGPLELCCGAEFWGELAGKGMFTPLLFLSLAADAAASGLEARGFYLHQLVAFSLAAAALYLILRLWLGRAPSTAAALLFAAGPPTASLVPLLMVRHYVEAVLLALLAVACFVRAVRTARWPWAAASAALYFAAALAKEIAVPLPLLLPLLPIGEARLRQRFTLPHAAALAAYLALRLALLGRLSGGYGWAVEAADLPGLALALPGKLLGEFLGRPSPAAWALLAAVAAGVAVAVFTSRRAALLLALAAALALLPVLPVSTEMEPRYAVAAWLAAIVAFAAGCDRLARRGGAARAAALGLAAAAAVAVLWSFSGLRGETDRRMRRLSSEGRAFLALGPGDFLRHPLGHPASFPELRWLKEERLRLPRGGGWFYDDLFLCTRGSEIRRLWEYDPARARVAEVTPRLAALRSGHCGRLRRRAPLAVVFEHSGKAVRWDLGPYRDGRWRLVLGDGVQVVEVPRHGGFHLPGARLLSLRVRYQAPSGWVTYSPQLTMDFARAPRQRWRRPS